MLIRVKSSFQFVPYCTVLLPTLSSEIDLLYLPLFRHRKNGQQSSFAGEKVHVCGSLDGQESTVSQAASLLFTFRGLNGVITSL